MRRQRTAEEEREAALLADARRQDREGPWDLTTDDPEYGVCDFEARPGQAILTDAETLSGHRGRQAWQLTRVIETWRDGSGREAYDVLFGRRWLDIRRGFSKTTYPMFSLDEPLTVAPAMRGGRGWRRRPIDQV